MRSEPAWSIGFALRYLKSFSVSRSRRPLLGTHTDATLSRIDAALKAGNLQLLLAESRGLSEAAYAPLSSWIHQVQVLADAQNCLARAILVFKIYGE